MARMPDIFAETAHAFEHAFRHFEHPGDPQPVTARARVIPVGEPFNPQAPATTPVNLAAAAAATTGGTMSLTTIEDAVKRDLTEGVAYLEEMAGRLKAAAPGIISTTEAVGNSTVAQLAEKLFGAFIPPQFEPVLIGLVEDFVKRYGQPAQAAPAQPAAPQQ